MGVQVLERARRRVHLGDIAVSLGSAGSLAALGLVDLTASSRLTAGALVFGVASFWWTQWRRGSLLVVRPSAFAFANHNHVRLRLPLVLVNTGAAPIVVADLRVVVDGHKLEWARSRATLRPQKDDFEDFATPFVVEGRQAHRVIAEFEELPAGWDPNPGESYNLDIDRLNRNGKWRRVGSFTLHVPADRGIWNQFIAYRNEYPGFPAALPPG